MAAVEAAGFTDVETYINTGNVRFDTPLRSRAKIEAALEKAFQADGGFEVPTIVFTPAELRADGGRGGRPSATPAGTTSRCSRRSRPRPRSQRVEEASAAEEVAKVGGRAVHLLLGENYHEAS